MQLKFLIKKIEEDDDTINAVVQTSLLPDKDIDLCVTFDGDEFDGFVKIPFLGKVKFKDGHACCVIMASDGYPESYDKGFEITMPDDKPIYVAGAALKDGKLVTSGGRVLGVTETATDLKTAIDKAYELVEKVHFENAYFRRDIGKKALEVR